MKTPLGPTLLALGALCLGGFIAVQSVGTAHAESSLGTNSLEHNDKGGHAIQLGGHDGGHAVEMLAR
jgi:hypothetical protein